MTATIESAPRPRDRRGWLTTDLPDVLHAMRSRFGEDLQARLVRPGDRFGVDGTLSQDETAKLEVRHSTHLDTACGFPGRVVAFMDVDELSLEASACWQLLHEAMPYAIDPAAWRALLAALDAALAAHLTLAPAPH